MRNSRFFSSGVVECSGDLKLIAGAQPTQTATAPRANSTFCGSSKVVDCVPLFSNISINIVYTSMVYTRLSRSITQPLAGMTVLALIAVVPSPTVAQPVNQVAPAPSIGPVGLREQPHRVAPASSSYYGQPVQPLGVASSIIKL